MQPVPGRPISPKQLGFIIGQAARRGFSVGTRTPPARRINERIGVIGAGQMSTGIAIVAARHVESMVINSQFSGSIRRWTSDGTLALSL